MEILTGEQMRRIDRRAIDEIGIPSLQLMESAGRGVTERLCEDYPKELVDGAAVVCGKGNNGGDGFVVARRLAAAGLTPRLFLLGSADQLAGDARINFEAARQAGLEVREIAGASGLGELRELLERRPVVVDALLGTGVRGGARGPAAEVIDAMNASGARIAAIDLPSGINADSPEIEGPAIRAERTYTLCRPKVALVFHPAAGHAGDWHVVPIGIPDEAVRAEAVNLEWLDAPAAAALLPGRGEASHKGDFGHLLAVAGSSGKSGAAVLLARGALRCGIGLMTVATPVSAQQKVAVQQAEVMTEPLRETANGALAADAAEIVLSLAAARDALAVGPGLGTDEETRAAVREVLRRGRCPTVVDADGLNALAPLDPETCRGGRPVVLTPHPGEAARLLGCSTAEIQSDRLAAARRLARIAGAIVILKGHRSLVARPDGLTFVNSTGNPGMASGGTGDVLTGAVGAFLARGLDAWDAARLATFIHGDAGDRAAAVRGCDGMIASDLVDMLPAALAALAG